MDRALKERITGAVVLVVIAVLVVPVFLDGAPNDAEMVTQTVTLPGQEEQSRKQQTIVLERDRDQPVPAGSRRTTPVTQPGEEAAAATSPATPPEQASAPPPVVGKDPAPEQQATAGQNQTPEPERQEPKAAEVQAETREPEQEEPKAATRVAQTATEPAPAAESTDSATGMWAVQLGSFSNPENAQRLASELRTNGYAAFLSQLKSANGALHRVRVGPQKDRESAEAVAKRLSGDGHAGQVVPHP